MRGSGLRWTTDRRCSKHAAEEHHEFLLTESPTGRECILEKKVKGTFSVNEKAERFLFALEWERALCE